MRNACVTVVAALLLLTDTGFAQTTEPSPGLAKENAELKQRIEKLEAYVNELEAKLRASKSAAKSPRAEIRPFTPAPYGYELPQLPFRAPVAPTPRFPQIKPRAEANVVPPLPGQSTPDQWKRREFNGAEYYLVPLK
jgi:hypothetical protein